MMILPNSGRKDNCYWFCPVVKISSAKVSDLSIVSTCSENHNFYANNQNMCVQSQHTHCNASNWELSIHLNVSFSEYKHIALASLMSHCPELYYMPIHDFEGTE